MYFKLKFVGGYAIVVAEVIMMSADMKNNEQRILDGYEKLKDRIFGLDQPFFKPFYTYSPRQGYQYDEVAANLLIESVLEHCAKDEQLFYSIMRDFLDISLKFLFVACNSDDWSYISFVKLSETIEKREADWVTTMDVMVGDEQEVLNDTYGDKFNETYNRLTDAILGKDLSEFPHYVKKSLEKHIDANGLNCLNDDEMTEEVLELMDQISRRVSMMYRRKVRGQREL